MKDSSTPAIQAATRLMAIVLVYSLSVAACQHSNEVSMLLDGICKIAVNALQANNNRPFDAGVDSGN